MRSFISTSASVALHFLAKFTIRRVATQGAVVVATSVAAVNLGPLIEREGHRNAAYYDSAGIPTICVGHVSDKKYPFKMGDAWSDEKCEEVLLWDMREATDVIDRLVTVPLNEHQYTALASFVFNIGNGAFANSTLLKVLNKGQYSEVPRQMRRWNKVTVNGKKVVSRGLKNRRESEVREWLGEL